MTTTERHRGRFLEADKVITKTIQVQEAPSRVDERFVSLTTSRLHATTVYVVAQVDGTGRLAGQLRVFTDGHAATKHADKLVEQARAERAKERIPNMRSARATPKQISDGRWRANVGYAGKSYKRTFRTKQQAEEFIDQVKAGRTPQ